MKVLGWHECLPVHHVFMVLYHETTVTYTKTCLLPYIIQVPARSLTHCCITAQVQRGSPTIFNPQATRVQLR